MNFSDSSQSAKKPLRPAKQAWNPDVRPLATKQDALAASAETVRRKPSARLKGVLLVLLLAVAIVGFRAVYRHIVYAGIDTARYQAVYLTNNNVYFGKVRVLVNGDVLLTDVFRVQAANAETSAANQTTSAASTAQSTAGDTAGGIRLIKPGKELHAPDDTMLIRRSNVLFMENLGNDGKVVQAIDDYHKNGVAN